MTDLNQSMADPTVSVLIPSYNHEKYVTEAIQSVLDQTYQDFEVIVTDDGSTDKTTREIEKFKDQRIKLYCFKKNRGAGIANKNCFNHSRGKYISILSSDDAFLPQKLEKQVRYLDEHPQIGAVFSYAQIIDDDGNDFRNESHFYYSIFNQANRTRRQWLHHFFYKGNCLCHPSLLIRRECYEKVGFYDLRFDQLGDFEFFTRLCMQYEIHIIPENLVKFRIRAHEANVSGNRPENHIRTRWELLQILKKNYLRINDTDEFVEIFPELFPEKDKIESDTIHFFLSMLALENNISEAHIFFGIDTIFSLLGDARIINKLNKINKFNFNDYINLTKKHQTFFTDFTKKDERIRDQQIVIENQHQTLIEKEAFMEKQQRVINDQHQTLIEKEAFMEKQQRVINDQHQTLVEKERYLQILTQVIQLLNLSIEEVQTKNADKEKVIDEKDRVIDKKNQLVNNYIAKLAENQLKLFFDDQFRTKKKFKALFRKKIRFKSIQIANIGLSADMYMALTNDPMITIGLENPVKYVKIIHRVQSELKKANIFLYFADSDNVFTESNKIFLGESDNQLTENYIDFPNEVSRLRIDPVDQKTDFQIHHFNIIPISKIEYQIRTFKKIKTQQETKQLDTKEQIETVNQVTDSGHSNTDYTYNAYFNVDLINKKISQFKLTPLISIIVPVYNVDSIYLEALIASIQNQFYSNYEVCIVDDCSTNKDTINCLNAIHAPGISIKYLKNNQGIAEATNTAIKMAKGDYLAFLDHDDELTQDSLFEVVQLINKHPAADIIYSDEDKISIDGSFTEPHFKPDWSPEFFRGVMYVGHLLVVRKETAFQAGLLDSNFDRIQDYEFMLRLSEDTTEIYHIPKVLYHWRQLKNSIASESDAKGDISKLHEKAVNRHLKRLNLDGMALNEGRPHRLRIYPKSKKCYPLVSIIIPSKDAPGLLNQCLTSIYEKTTYPNFEVILVDNGTSDKDAIKIMNSYPLTIVPFHEAFNYSKTNNLGASKANGDFIIFLNNDTEIVTDSWIENLLYFAEQKDVGAVGPLMLYPDKSVQHAGVVLGLRGTADHIMKQYPEDGDGYFGSLYCSRSVSAVTGACMMIRKATFEDVGGFNEYYAFIYQDTDLCLKLRKNGYRILYVATAKLIHHESASRGDDYDLIDRVLLLDQWRHEINADPYYNPNFDKDNFIIDKKSYALKPVTNNTLI